MFFCQKRLTLKATAKVRHIWSSHKGKTEYLSIFFQKKY